MNKPNDYDNVRVSGSNKTLPAGGYVCKVLNCTEMTTSTGEPMIKAALEIVEGAYAGFFKDKYEQRDRWNTSGQPTKWAYDGTAYINALDYNDKQKTSRDFKSFVEACRAGGKVPQWGDHFAESLTGAVIGVLYQRKEKWNSDGTGTYMQTLPHKYIPAQDIRDGNYKVPEDYHLPENKKPAGNQTQGNSVADAFQGVDDDIPF